MTTPEPHEILSKQEYLYLQTIEKQNILIEHLKKETEALRSANEIPTKALTEIKATVEQMTKELETLKGTHEEVAKELTQIKPAHEQLKADLEETTKESQAHVDNIESQNDDLLKQIEELNKQVLTPEEMLFFYGAKADLIFAELFPQKSILNLRDLREKKFPMVLLESNRDGKEPSVVGVTTTNFRLIRTGINQYQLFQN